MEMLGRQWYMSREFRKKNSAGDMNLGVINV